MLSVFETGEAAFRLSDAHDENVGWIRGSAVGFDGFEDESQAIDAALAGSEALRSHLDRVTGATEPAAPARGPVRVVHDGAYEWVSRGSMPLARLHRPIADGAPAGRRGYAIEFVLPSYVRAGSVISAAQVVHRAVARVPRAHAAPGPDGRSCDAPVRAATDRAVAVPAAALAGADAGARAAPARA